VSKFSDFIRNASVEEKTDVYRKVMDAASKKQNDVLSVVEYRVEGEKRPDGYDEATAEWNAAYKAGLETGRKYVKACVPHGVGPYVATPKNKHTKDSIAFDAWKEGYDEAIAEWYR